MKAFILSALLLLFFFPGRAQVTIIPIDSFMGINFGATQEAVKARVKALGGEYDAKTSKRNFAVFNKVNWNNRATDYIYFRFTDNDQMFEGGAYFKATNKVQTIPLFLNIRHDVALQYSEGVDTRSFSGDFSNGDGNELTAIETGNGTYSTQWIEDKFNTKYNTINLTINPDLYVQLQFVEAKFSKQRKK